MTEQGTDHHRAVALKAALDKESVDALTPLEQTLLAEWLDRIAR